MGSGEEDQYISVSCTVRVDQDLGNEEGEEESRRYQLYSGDARHGIITVRNAHSAARMIVALLADK